MENQATQKRITELLIKNEAAMSDLYRIYADRFPEFKKFWHNLSEDEQSHAAWINTLYYKLKTGLVSFAEQRFPTDAIGKFTEYINEEKAKVNRGEMSLLYALETSTNIERGLIENKFFEVFKDDSMELQIILEALRLGTQQHLREVQAMWEKEKGGSETEKLKA